MAQAYVRVKDSGEEWRPMTWSRMQFQADKQQLEMMVEVMRQNFPNNEYKVEEQND